MYKTIYFIFPALVIISARSYEQDGSEEITVARTQHPIQPDDIITYLFVISH